jgi:hypothetical protein
LDRLEVEFSAVIFPDWEERKMMKFTDPQIALRAGDYVEIPAGMPHSVRPAADGKIRYVLFNTRE